MQQIAAVVTVIIRAVVVGIVTAIGERSEETEAVDVSVKSAATEMSATKMSATKMSTAAAAAMTTSTAVSEYRCG